MDQQDRASPWSEELGLASDLPAEGASCLFETGGRRIAVFRIEGRLYAVDDFCTHSQSSLSEEGILCGLVVECALHRAQFSLETGEALRGPTRKPLRHYTLDIEGGKCIATEAPRAKFRGAREREGNQNG